MTYMAQESVTPRLHQPDLEELKSDWSQWKQFLLAILINSHSFPGEKGLGIGTKNHLC